MTDLSVTPQSLRAAVYARKSTDDSDRSAEARSTARQIDSATQYAALKGWTVDSRHIYIDENTSGAEWKHRPRFNALLAALEPRPPFDVLIISELSRIGRDTVRVPYAVQQIEETGVEIHGYLAAQRISVNDEMGEMQTMLHSMSASYERRRARQRSYDALRCRAEAGAVTGGRVFGYQNQRDGNGYVYRVIDETEAATVRRIFTLYAEGNGLTRIAKRLNEDGVPAPRVGTGSWCPSAVREIIRRPLYAGIVVWNKSQKIMRRGTKAYRRRPETEWLRRYAPELRIVSDDLWRAVEQRRERAATTFAGTTRDGRHVSRPSGADLVSPYLLSGLTACAWCGGSLTSFSRPHGVPGARQRVPGYACDRHAKRGAIVCKNDVWIPQEKLDAAFLDALAEAINERLIARAVEKALARVQRGRTTTTDERAALLQRRTTVETGIRHLLDAVKLGHATETLLAEIQRQEAEAKVIARELADLDSRARIVPIEGKQLEARLTALGRNLRGVLERKGPPARRLLQRVLNGRRIACHPFREGRLRGYRFEEKELPYSALFTNVGGPNGIRTRV